MRVRFDGEWVIFLALALAACDGGGDKEGAKAEEAEKAEGAAAEEVEPAAEPEPEPEPRSCRVTSYAFQLGKSERTMAFHYGEALERIELTMGKKKQTLTFERDEQGRLKKVADGKRASLTYEWNDAGRLSAIRGQGYFGDRIFSHDDAGRITRREVKQRGRTLSAITFAYEGDSTCPSESQVLERDEVTEVTALEYDDKQNPLRGVSALANPGEMLMGYPVGNCAHNVTKMTTTYKKRTKWKINGKRRGPGDVLTRVVAYEYDEAGYPTERTRGTDEAASPSDGEGDPERFTYECS